MLSPPTGGPRQRFDKFLRWISGVFFLVTRQPPPKREKGERSCGFTPVPTGALPPGCLAATSQGRASSGGKEKNRLFPKEESLAPTNKKEAGVEFTLWETRAYCLYRTVEKTC